MKPQRNKEVAFSGGGVPARAPKRTRGRPKTSHDSRRAEIAQAACEAILQSGLEKVRLADIAAESGVTTGALQHYFRNKEELLLFVKNFLFDQVLESTRVIAEKHEGPDRLRAIIDHLIPTSGDRIKAFLVLEAFRGRAISDPQLLAIQHDRDEIWLKILRDELTELRAGGYIRSDVSVEREAIAISALLGGLGALVMAAPRTFKRPDLDEIMQRYLERCVGLGPSRTG